MGISQEVYERFSKEMPESNARIEHMDNNMKGRMLEQIFKLLLDETEEGYLDFETQMHKSYGANVALYSALLLAIKETVRDVTGKSWSEEKEMAWNGVIEKIVNDIERLASE